MTERRFPSEESHVELRQWWYGKESVIEYISTVAFQGPFRGLVSENGANYESLRWSELPGTDGRYRAALARTEVMVLASEQRYDRGNSPSSCGIDGSVEISGRSSLAGDITENETREVWKFSETTVDPSGYYNIRGYCSGAKTIPLSKIYGSASRDISVALYLTFHIKEPAAGTPDDMAFPLDVLVALAENLTSQGNCDVGFACKDGLLYAISPILKARSEYFAKMFAFDQIVLSPDQDGETATKDRLSLYQQKESEEPFDLLHNILYYLYTDRITFSTNLDNSLPANLPRLCSAEDIYVAADRMFLTELKEKALNFLKLSCTTENITSRVLSNFADVHAEVGTTYTDYFRRNWDRVKGSEYFDQSFEDMEDGSDEKKQAEKKFRDLMRDAIFPQ